MRHSAILILFYYKRTSLDSQGLQDLDYVDKREYRKIKG